MPTTAVTLAGIAGRHDAQVFHIALAREKVAFMVAPRPAPGQPLRVVAGVS
jgi:hypothetical protein